MKTIEKMAIEQIITQLSNESGAEIGDLVKAKAALEEAKKAFIQAAGPLVNKAKHAFAPVKEEVSAEAAAYYEAQITEKIGLHNFKL